MQIKPIPALSLCAALLVLAACSKPAMPDPERPPEPTVTGQSAAARAIHEPLDRAKAIEDTAREAGGPASGDRGSRRLGLPC